MKWRSVHLPPEGIAMAGYPPELEAYIEQKVQSGEFSSRDDFQAEAIRLYRELEQRHHALKLDVAAALAESEQGESIPLDLDALKQELINEVDEQGNLN
jgi:putative addiction module CopG family antidote